MKTIVIIVAAGLGQRMNTATTKQLIHIGSHPILWHTLQAFQTMNCVDEVVLVVKEEEKVFIEHGIVEAGGFSKVAKVVSGGKERSDSVFNGLKAAGTCSNILIHDGARPFVRERDVVKLLKALELNKGAILAVPVKDTIKQVDSNEEVLHTYNRNELRAVQTPQAFRYEVIREAFESADKIETVIYDDAMMVEATSSERIKVVIGDEKNIKITTPFDLIIGEVIYNMNRGEDNV